MFFETAGIEVAVWIPPLVGLVVCTICSTAGVSGAFLLLPFLVSVLGYTSPGVSATNQLYNVLSNPGGLWRYWREGRLLGPLALTVAVGTLPGVLLGVLMRVTWFPDARRFKFFVSLVLLFIAYRLGKDVYEAILTKKSTEAENRFHRAARNGGGPLPRPQVVSFGWCRLEFEFMEQRFSVACPWVFLLSLAVGTVGGVYGIGGAAIMAPFLVSVLKLPVYVVAGATILGNFLTATAAVLSFYLLAPYFPQYSLQPDIALGVLFGVGGLVGSYLGARLQKYLPASVIKLLLLALVLYTAAKYLLAFFG